MPAISLVVDELPLRERLQFAHTLLGYLMSVASAHRRADLRLVQDTSQDVAS